MGDIPNNPDAPPEALNPGDFKMPSMEELLKIVETMDMDEASREDLKASILSGGAQNPANLQPPGMASDIVILLGLIAFIILLFVFFGYKLYRTLTERERKKQEKKLKKQLKKRK